MPRTEIQDLLEKYKSGTINPEEMALLETWYLQWQIERPEISHPELEAAKAEVWKTIQISTLKTSASRRWLLPSIAASVLLFVSVFSYYFLLEHNSAAEHKVLAKTVQTDFKPGSNKAILTLSGGQQIVLTDAGTGKLADEGSTGIIKTQDGKLVYNGNRGGSTASDRMIYNTMTTPRGGQYHMILSDGTQVWLNAGSSITYPVAFKGRERKVSLNGEAYFEVAHQKQKPFMVSTGNQEITVLGTHFNVNSYPDDASIRTTLLSGSVKVKNVSSGLLRMLVPGEASTIVRGDQGITVNAVNTDEAIAWKNGYFIFDNQELKNIMKIMSRWYDVDVEYAEKQSHDRFGGTFSRSSNLSETLKNLEQIGKVHFKLMPGEIIVTD